MRFWRGGGANPSCNGYIALMGVKICVGVLLVENKIDPSGETCHYMSK